MWTNVTVGVNGTVIVDLTASSTTRFYRLFTAPLSRFVWIEPGTFGMGSPISEFGRYDDEQFHTVTLTKGFWISNHEVTQSEYLSIMGVNPSFFVGLELPVESVSWINAVEYCNKLTDRERAAGRINSQQAYRLPTEAEWEYAARASKNVPPSNDNAWWGSNSDSKTHPVRWKSPNNWGLYDMLGNVGEWCEDQWNYFSKNPVTDPRFSGLGAPNTTRVWKGGGYDYLFRNCRLASRHRLNGDQTSRVTGFRVVLSDAR
jgi:formylglycine-generating enzyme required for sulfatase activity